MRCIPLIAVVILVSIVTGCSNDHESDEPSIRPALHTPGEHLERSGDEIVACGQFFHTGNPVITWMDPGGYDAYRVEPRFAPFDKSSWPECCKETPTLTTPNRYNLRKDALTPEQIERVRGGGWDLPLLQDVVDQFVFHYDMSGTSKRCFTTLHDKRCLSVHFMIDLDGTIYQTLDLKERAWHATTSNTRSIGVEISNVGAFGKDENTPFEKWYGRDENGHIRITLPPEIGDGGVHTPNFIGHPIREEPVTGEIQGRELRQYDFTPQQYDALIKLTATLCKIFPKLKCDFPHDENGKLIPQKLPDEQLNAYQGLLGHYHIQTNKVDPGPALQWERIVKGARELMTSSPR
jgi:N-acetyl-anhydromuramyl-L-alanine amidase AmpD